VNLSKVYTFQDLSDFPQTIIIRSSPSPSLDVSVASSGSSRFINNEAAPSGVFGFGFSLQTKTVGIVSFHSLFLSAFGNVKSSSMKC
jgi:hypothetical protein